MKSIIRFLKKLFGIFFFIETIVGILLVLFLKSEDVTVVHRSLLIIVTALFALLTYLLLFKRKKNIVTTQASDKITTSTLSATAQSFIQYANAKDLTSNIANEEALRLEQERREQIKAYTLIPRYIDILNETYKIIYNTNNPETLCSRYNFAQDKLAELTHYKTQGFIDKQFDLSRYSEMFSDDSFYKLTLWCYKKYIDKAKTELTTKKGVENRANKFWKIMQENVSSELYTKLRASQQLNSDSATQL